MFSNPAIPICLLAVIGAIVALLKRHRSHPEYQVGAGHEVEQPYTGTLFDTPLNPEDLDPKRPFYSQRADASIHASMLAAMQTPRSGHWSGDIVEPRNFEPRGPIPFDQEKELHAPYGRPRL